MRQGFGISHNQPAVGSWDSRRTLEAWRQKLKPGHPISNTSSHRFAQPQRHARSTKQSDDRPPDERNSLVGFVVGPSLTMIHLRSLEVWISVHYIILWQARSMGCIPIARSLQPSSRLRNIFANGIELTLQYPIYINQRSHLYSSNIIHLSSCLLSP